ncbi:MAG: aminodeoxychorismate/anthranilate synthase component II [Alphaproteobacteria bacterium]|nr:aminodeoxychorismate/anthranilate synthase component II [Alphaproteobacteria bacterium]
MILVIDNYDSFVHNLARYISLAGCNYEIVRNDKITLKEIHTIKPKALVLSPGPYSPKKAGICINAVKEFGANIPILGVCLGHQAIGEAYGAKTSRAKKPMHGKSSKINHNEKDIFAGLPTPMKVGRYHSLIVDDIENTNLLPTAMHDNEIMAIQHKTHPVYGVQFHPESILTEHGQIIINNFTAIAQQWHQEQKEAA